VSGEKSKIACIAAHTSYLGAKRNANCSSTTIVNKIR
jgi:hypothetical protein